MLEILESVALTSASHSYIIKSALLMMLT